MKKKILNFKTLACCLGFCFAMCTINVFAQDKSTSVTGEVLDMDCYMKGGAHGADHKSCAEMCIKGGAPMGILTSDGKVYLLVADDNNKSAYDGVKAFAGQEVTVTGEYSEKDGIKGIIVAEVKGKS